MKKPAQNRALPFLRQSPAFDHINKKALEQLSLLFTIVFFEDGENIPIRRDNNEPALFLITSGCFDFNLSISDIQNKTLITFTPTDLAGDYLSHISHINNLSLRSNGKSTTFRILRDDLDEFFDSHQGGLNHFTEIIHTKFYQTQLSLFFFTKFQINDPNIFDYLSHEVEWLRLRNGETLFCQGDTANDIYVVLSGRLKSMVHHGNGESSVSNIISAGEVSGEVALLTHSNRIATVFAIRDSMVAKVTRNGFNQVTKKHPHSLLQIATLLGNRVKFQAGKDTYRDNSKTYAIVPAQKEERLNSFAQELHQSMCTWGSTIYLTSNDVDKALGIDGIANDDSNITRITLVAQWLEHQELIHDHILLIADAYWSKWNERILRLSDHVLIIADTDYACKSDEHEEKIFNTSHLTKHQKKSLILLHSNHNKPILGTALWLENRQINDWYHVRTDINSDMSRLGRLLTGNANALVLGGGGARGYAHIGVIRALEEQGIPIDRVCGTSIGAIISSGIALGHDSKGISQLCKRLRNKLFDYTLPLLSLIKGRRIEKELDAIFGEQHIEDLIIPFFCISTNLTRAEQVIHTRGLLKDALRCSMSLPAVFPPVYIDGDLIVDGGLLNNLPIDVMRKSTESCNIIASDISPKLDLTNYPKFSSNISGFQLLLSKLNPFKKNVQPPSIFQVLERSITVSAVSYSEKIHEQNIADLYIKLPVENVSTLSYNNVEQTSSLGYKASIKLITNWSPHSN